MIKLGFRPDNVRMSLDGTAIFAAGHTDKDGHSIVEPREPLRERSNVARVNPQTLEFQRIFQHVSIDGFVASTTAIQIGNEMWLGVTHAAATCRPAARPQARRDGCKTAG